MRKTVIVRLNEPLFGGGQKEVYFFNEGGGPQLVGDGSSADQVMNAIQGQGFALVEKTSRVAGDRRITDWKLTKDFQTPWG